eukprot:4094253-Pyramimonas_sp.AAC.1
MQIDASRGQLLGLRERVAREADKAAAQAFLTAVEKKYLEKNGAPLEADATKVKSESVDEKGEGALVEC